MTDLLAARRPRTPATRTRPPHRSPARASMTARRAVAMTLAVLLTAALLDAEALHATASAQPLGWRQDAALLLADPLLAASHALHLTALRQRLLVAVNRGDDPAAPPAPTAPAPSPPPTDRTAPRVAPDAARPITPAPGPDELVPPASAPPQPAPPPHQHQGQARQRSPAQPLRLWVVGDSMTETFGPALVNLAATTRAVDAERDLRYSSGLTRPDFFDWPAHLADGLEHRPADAVVVMFGANDAQGIQTPAGAEPFGTPAWQAEYRGRVAATMDLLQDRAATTYWIGLPIMRPDDYRERMRLLNDLYAAEADRHPAVTFIDTWMLFADSAGAYNAYLDDDQGRPALMRRQDGIHLTDAGGRRLAAAVLDAINHDWTLTD